MKSSAVVLPSPWTIYRSNGPINSMFKVCTWASNPSTTPLGLIFPGFINIYKRYLILFSQVQRSCTALPMDHIQLKRPINCVFETCIWASNPSTTPLGLIFPGFINIYKRYLIVFYEVQRSCTALAMDHIQLKQPIYCVFETCIWASNPSTTPLGLIFSEFINNHKRYLSVFSQVQRSCTALAMDHLQVERPINSAFEVCIRG